MEPASNSVHPNGCRGIADIRLFSKPADVAQQTEVLTRILGQEPEDDLVPRKSWMLTQPGGPSGDQGEGGQNPIVLNLEIPAYDKRTIGINSKSTSIEGIADVSFWVSEEEGSCLQVH